LKIGIGNAKVTNAAARSAEQPESHAREIQRIRAAIEEADAQIRRLSDAVAERRASWNNLAVTVQAIDDWLRSLPREARITDHAGTMPKLRKGADPTSELASVRDRIVNLHADRHETMSGSRFGQPRGSLWRLRV
jgi:hypothetical protein